MSIQSLAFALEFLNLKLHQLVDKANLVYLRQLVDILYFKMLVVQKCDVKVSHPDNLPKEGPAILVANHSSHMDAGVIQALFPISWLPYIRPVGAKEHFTKSLLWHLFARGFMRLLFVERGSGETAKSGALDPFEEVHEHIGKGGMVIYFPSGTRTKGASFKAGIVHLAQAHPGVPIIPFLLKGTAEVLPPNTVGFKPGPIEVHVGKPFIFDKGLSPADNAKALEEYVLSLDQ